MSATFMLVVSPCRAATPAAAPPMSEEDKAFYSLGLELAQGISVFSLSARELELVQAGLKDGTLKNKDGSPLKRPLVEKEEFRQRLQSLAQERQAASAPAPAVAEPVSAPAADAPAVAKANQLSPAEFLKEAAKVPGARKLLSGVVYTSLKKVAHGRSPRSTDTVKVHYRGTLIDGTEFDSSFKRNEPATFPLNAVIPCWTQGVAVMKVGEKARLVCPSDTAYGASGSPPTVPGGAVLVFEVELLGIEP
jgi:FKBP-type peptidyl-prolyl cis-trans isomerase FkpA